MVARSIIHKKYAKMRDMQENQARMERLRPGASQPAHGVPHRGHQMGYKNSALVGPHGRMAKKKTQHDVTSINYGISVHSPASGRLAHQQVADLILGHRYSSYQSDQDGFLAATKSIVVGE